MDSSYWHLMTTFNFSTLGLVGEEPALGFLKMSFFPVLVIQSEEYRKTNVLKSTHDQLW